MNTTGKKFGGRGPGVENKRTTAIKDSFILLVENNLDLLNSDLRSLDPLNRLKIILELSKYILPQLRAVEANVLTNEGINMINLGMGTIPDIMASRYESNQKD